ncbi:MAG TPA: FecR domain-containing protein [Gemmataceae bacterium]|nr:FecR domain-containing protein [Gemmataceae bacterium]
MNDFDELPEQLQALIDAYLAGRLDEVETRKLERFLLDDERARRYFVRYAQMHIDLHLQGRAHGAAARALEQVEGLVGRAKARADSVVACQVDAGRRPRSVAGMVRSLLRRRTVRIAAGLLLALVLGYGLARAWSNAASDEAAIAWLVNAQDCTWFGPGPMGNLQSGKILSIEHGLAEIHFRSGARVLLEGPATLELLSPSSARLASGRLTARVPASAAGFTIVSPQGKVIDLGTEFGMQAGSSSTEVYVFQGRVEAVPALAAKVEPSPVSLTEHQSARITAGGVLVRPQQPVIENQFVRTIVPTVSAEPQTFHLGFDRALPDSIKDSAGRGTGLTHRLPGTGKDLPAADSNLRVDTARAQLALMTTNSDLNTQYKLNQGEYLGIRLAELGFTGVEDFAVTVTLPNIPALEAVGQFGLYAGAGSDCNIRGGLIGADAPGNYTQFLVKNKEGTDTADICKVGLLTTGTDLRLKLQRLHGRYSLAVENLTTGSTSTLTIRHPDFLDNKKDLYVGLFGANTQSEVRKTLIFKDFQVTVWKTQANIPD